jgi:tRNA threonylcarbamoyladenosine biosynthesis protein TsaE
MIEQWLPDPEAQLAFGARLAALLPPRLIVYLEGDLGTGKTTLTRGVLAGLGHRGAVRSPTYTLLEPYEIGERRLNHLDLYRLGDPRELEYLGLRDLLAEDAVWMVEWPERGLGMLPSPDLLITIEYAANGRRLLLSARTASGEFVLETLADLRSADSQRSASPEKSDVMQ